MSTIVSRLALRGLAFAAVLAASHAFAADAKQIADSLVAAVGAKGQSTATYDNASASGDDVTITNFKITGGGSSLAVPSLVISGAQPRDKGGFTATKMQFDNAAMTTDDNSNVKWATASVDGATVPSPDEIKAATKMTPFTGLQIAGLNISGGDLQAPIDIDSVNVKVAETDGVPSDFTMSVASLKLPPELFSDPQAKAVLGALGYNGFTVNIGLDGGYEHGSDTLTLRSFAIDTADVGKLTITGKFTGVPLGKAADANAEQEWLKTGKLNAFGIRFDNAGIVERALKMQAGMQGVPPDQVVAQDLGVLPLMFSMANISNQAFQDKLIAAATTFLKEPKSITITASPAQPVPFETLGAAIGQAPQTLPDVLAVDVQANN